MQDPQLFWQTPVMSAVTRELARQALLDAERTHDADTLAWNPSLVRFPHPEMTTLSLTGRIIAPCIFAACMFGAVTQVRRGRRAVPAFGSGQLAACNGSTPGAGLRARLRVATLLANSPTVPFAPTDGAAGD